MNTLTDLSDDELLTEITSVLGSERRFLTKLIRYLAEVEERRLHLRAGYASMFDFCTEKLRLSEGQAFRRLIAARLSQRFTVILELIESGAIHLSALVLLRDHLTGENHAELLRQACGLRKTDLLAQFAARFPKPDVAGTIRKVPVRQVGPAIGQSALALAAPVAGTPVSTERPPAQGSIESRVEPLSPARYKVQFTADQELKDKLERLGNLLSHINPKGDLAFIIERAVDFLLVDVEKKRLGKTDRPRRSRAHSPGTITRSARRIAFARDGERCSFVSEDGRHCKARAFLQLDHIEPRALGGSGESTKIRVLCAAHNRLFAEQIFGKQHVEAAIRFRQQKYRSEAPASATRDDTTPGRLRDRALPATTEHDETYKKLFSGLTGLGFRPKPTRATLDLMRSGKSSVAWTAPIAELLREAAQLLTK